MAGLTPRHLLNSLGVAFVLAVQKFRPGGFRVFQECYIPAPAIYWNNAGNGKYRFLIPALYAVDCYMGDATICDSRGRAKPGFECPQPFNASSFGEKFAALEHCTCSF